MSVPRSKPAAPRLHVAVLVAAALGAASTLAAQDVDDVGGLARGAYAPRVTVADSAGRPVPLPVSRGRPTLIEFWAVWCEYCARLEPRIKAAYARYHDRVDFGAVAVNVNETRARVYRHAAAHRLPYAVWYDASGDATRAYDVAATSYVVVLDGQQRVVYSGLGDTQDLDRVLARAVNAAPTSAARNAAPH